MKKMVCCALSLMLALLCGPALAEEEPAGMACDAGDRKQHAALLSPRQIPAGVKNHNHSA